MIFVAFTLFIMGLRHGADPDHLAAIDNLTRNSSERMPIASRLTGLFFALGHSAMVIAMAILAGLLGAHFGSLSSGFTRFGEIASIAILLVMVAFNVITLMGDGNSTLRTRLLPKRLSGATHPAAAVPTGALFGIGFETPSQLAAYGVAFSTASWIQGLLIGSAFCLGMIVTDTLDSVLLARLFSGRVNRAKKVRKIWILTVTLVALGVAIQEIVGMFGIGTALNEGWTSALIVALLAAVALAMLVLNSMRRQPDVESQ